MAGREKMGGSTPAALMEGAAEEMMAVEPEVVDGNVKIEFPFANNARLSNFIRFHHPDGTHSDLAAPTFNPQRPSPYRRRFLQHWLAKPGPQGQRWYFLQRQADAPELPIRCFIHPGGVQCAKRVPTLPDLYMHVIGKHGEESKMYAEVLQGMNQKMQAQIDPETLAALGIGAIEAEAPKAETPEVFYCKYDACPRFFDSEEARGGHQGKCPQKEAD